MRQRLALTTSVIVIAAVALPIAASGHRESGLRDQLVGYGATRQAWAAHHVAARNPKLIRGCCFLPKQRDSQDRYFVVQYDQGRVFMYEIGFRSLAGIPSSRRQQGLRDGTPSIGGPAGAAAACAAWEGASSALTVCQPKLLRTTIVKGEMGTRIRPNIRIARFRGHIYAVKGVTQAVGQPLAAGQRATIRGPLERGSEVAVRLLNHGRRWIAWFKLARVANSRTGSITIQEGSRPRVRIRLPDRILSPRYLELDPG